MFHAAEYSLSPALFPDMSLYSVEQGEGDINSRLGGVATTPRPRAPLERRPRQNAARSRKPP